MCFGIIYKSAHGPGVMFFRIIVQPVRILLVATNKNSVIHYPLRQPLRVPVRSLIQLCPASPRPLLLTPVYMGRITTAHRTLLNDFGPEPFFGIHLFVKMILRLQNRPK